MKAKNLRIGNCVKIPTKGTEIIIPSFEAQVQSIGLFGMIGFLNTPKIEGVKWTAKAISPIPLTDEWLIKLGFTKVGINYEKDWLILWKNKTTGTVDFVLNEPHSGKRHITALEYVHELQNLFFAISGNELACV